MSWYVLALHVRVWFLRLSVVLFSFGLVACQIKTSMNIYGSKSITGKIQNFSSLSTSKVSTSEVDRLSSCSNEVVKLYSLGTDGKKDSFITSTAINDDGHYSFTNLSQLGIDLDSLVSTTSYVLEFSCGDLIYERFLTGQAEQDLSAGSTLLNWLTQTNINTQIVNQKAENWNQFYDSLKDVSTITEAYSTLNSNSNLKNLFQATFGEDPGILLDATPTISSQTLPSQVSEEVGAGFSVQARHWSSAYDIAYDWRLGSQHLSNLSSFTYTPTANSQGEHQLRLFVGRDDGFGNVDWTKPYTQKIFQLKVNNTLPPTVPSVILFTAEYTNSTAVQLHMNTGPNVDGQPQNCRSFSKLAFLEEGYPAVGLAPVLSASYDRECTTASTQAFNITLEGPEGRRTLRFWARDASGNISLLSEDVSVVYDITDPVISFSTSFDGLSFAGGSSQSITWNSTEAFPASLPVSIDLSTNGGVSWSSVASDLADSGTYAWTLPAIDSTEAKLRLTMVDLAGNTGTASTLDFSIDSTKPNSPAISLSSSTPSNSSDVDLSLTCLSDHHKILLSLSSSAPTANSPNWQDCASSVSFDVGTGDGLKTIYVWAKDAVENVSSSSNSVSMTLDTLAPVLTQTSIAIDGSSTYYSNQDSLIWGGACEGNNNIEITGADNQVIACSSGSWTYDVADKTADGTYTYEFTHTDAAGNSTTLTLYWLRNTTKPTLSLMQVNDGVSSTTSNFLQLDVTASDSFDKITHFCFKYNSTDAPNLNDTCWLSVDSPSPGLTPSQNITIDNFSFPVGFAVGTYTISAWMRDELGNISDNTTSEGQDQASILYSPGTPPKFEGFLSGNSDIPANGTSFKNTPIGTNVYIKWKASDDEGLAANPIDLYYTTDDSTYSLIASGLANASNGACNPDDTTSTLDDDYTGCYLWSGGAPSGDYFSIKAFLKDNSQFTVSTQSTPHNTSQINVIAGNTSVDLGVSGRTAVLFNLKSDRDYDFATFVVADTGDIYFNDTQRGLLKIDASTGTIDQFLSVTGSSTGDGGSIEDATARSIFKITMDYNNGLLIYDYDRIRRIDLNTSPATIDTLIGGGSSNNDGISATDQQLPGLTRQNISARKYLPLIALPNGDVYFQSSTGTNTYAHYSLKVYKGSTDQKIYNLSFTGTGNAFNAAQDITLCKYAHEGIAFNPNNSTIRNFYIGLEHEFSTGTDCPGNSVNGSTVFLSKIDPVTLEVSADTPPPQYVSSNNTTSIYTGMNGRIYEAYKQSYKIRVYNEAENKWDHLLGTGTGGTCDDGTPALSCDMMADDFFVSSSGRLYFLDRGRIRMVDGNNLVQTLAGQEPGYGEDYAPSVARFGRVVSFDQDTNKNVYVSDVESMQITRFSPSGNLERIAGNGTNANSNFTTPARDQGIRFVQWGYLGDFSVNPDGSELYMATSPSVLSKLNLTTGLWSKLVGQGGTSYWNANGLPGNQISLSYSYPGRVLGFSGTKVLLGGHEYNGPGYRHRLFNLYDKDDGTQEAFLGKDTTDNADSGTLSCADDTPNEDCGLGSFLDEDYLRNHYDPYTGKWYVGHRSVKAVRIVTPGNGNTVKTLATLPRNFVNFTYYRNADATVEMLYYCSSGRLYKYDLNTDAETALYWEIPSMSCDSRSLLYDADNDKLIFAFQQNGLWGLAEYINP